MLSNVKLIKLARSKGFSLEDRAEAFTTNLYRKLKGLNPRLKMF